ncbi:uncharacterized protein LOC122633783 [Vespula pensylvanica]|uniref:uncharacterized protein LOC122633783 n=1 Tax=Vespula pensylvanica TaxID=30213 RepID=UPI001CBA5B2F|nr:uncharacterized protein LOC122633783 [Vespula pensylvanica]
MQIIYYYYDRMKIRIPFERNQNYIPRISYSGTSQKELDWIVDIIKRYIRVTEYVHLINKLFKITYLLAILFVMVFIIFDFLYMFQLSEILLNISKTIECGICIAGSLLVTYLICYIGQMLINHNSTVLEELCQIPFYVLSEKTQKLLLFVIARSMRPCQISTNGIFVVSHELFANMKSIYAHFKFDYMQLSDENELNIFEKYTKQSKIYTYCFIDKNHLKLPFSINGVTTPGVLYYSLLIYQIIAIYISIIIANVCYSSYLTFVQHACCQLSILKIKIRQPFLNKKTYSQKTWLNKKNEEFNWIMDIIMRHRRVTKFVYLLNYLSKMTYIIVISFAMFLIVLDLLNIFQLTAILQNIGELMECSFYIVGSLFNVYINFYIGQTLINHSNAAFEELRQVPFYILSTKTQKLLLTITLRSMKPCVLSIGGIFISSYEVFSAVLEKAFSFAMVFYNVH